MSKRTPTIHPPQHMTTLKGSSNSKDLSTWLGIDFGGWRAMPASPTAIREGLFFLTALWPLSGELLDTKAKRLGA